MNREIFYIPCPNCSGDWRIGKKDGQTVRNCPRCDGTGEIPVNVDEGLEMFQEIGYAEALRISGNRELRRNYEAY